MPDKTDLPNIVDATQKRISSAGEGALDALGSLVNSAKKRKESKVAPGYHSQVDDSDDNEPRRKKPPKRETRSVAVNARLTPTERDRLYDWCDEQQMSLADGIIKLMDITDENSN